MPRVKFDDPLNTVVRLDDATPVIRIPRKKRKESIPQEAPGSNEISRISDPETPANLADSYLSIQREITEEDVADTEKIEAAIRAAALDPEQVDQLVDLLMKMTALITGKRYHNYQITWMRRIYRAVLLDTPDESRTITVNISRQAGKSEGMAGVAVVLPVVMPALAKIFPDKLGRYKDGFHLAIFAPTDRKSVV